MLISTSELNSILENSDVIVADTRSFKEYSEGHIPGAVHLDLFAFHWICLLYTSPSPRDRTRSRMPSSA